ncbi:hypothetical protein Patl1_26285 [Pistacia atlantica]|uniref:Uncharacterized protein n=1 Tax=Pistacia atlantica TaxID=434234 RepID=A0ACC1B1V9_9ROSI|nr:hypothetical protein Patl1_26285 [Pistacia atlantica]
MDVIITSTDNNSFLPCLPTFIHLYEVFNSIYMKYCAPFLSQSASNSFFEAMNSLQLNSFPINAHYRFSNKIDNTSCIYNTFYGFSSQLKLNLKKNTLKLGSKSVAKERVSIHSELSVVYDKKPKVESSKNGIGILNFLPGKNYFISGATGLLAKGKRDNLSCLMWISIFLLDTLLILLVSVSNL